MIENLSGHLRKKYHELQTEFHCDRLTSAVIASKPLLVIGYTAAYLVGSSMWHRPGWRRPAALVLSIGQTIPIAQACARLSLNLRQIPHVDNKGETFLLSVCLFTSTVSCIDHSCELLKYCRYLDPSPFSSKILDKLYKPVHYLALTGVFEALWHIAPPSNGFMLLVTLVATGARWARGPTQEPFRQVHTLTWDDLIFTSLCLAFDLYVNPT